MDTLQDHVIDFVREQGLLEDRDSWLLCVSGGADSMALLYLARDLRRLGLLADCLCVHFNHQLRGAAADQDQAFVRQQAEKLSIRSIVRTLPVQALARENRLSVETAARELRWRACAQLAREHGCSAIATGHQKDDNAETVLDRISRGTGFRGLAGIWPSRSREACRIVRPLLCVTREEIRQSLASRGIAWREDPTNADCRIRRNFIRHRVLPHLQETSEKPLLEALDKLSSTCRRHHQHTCEQAGMLRPQALSHRESGVHLDASRLAGRPPWVRLELIRQALHLAGCGERNLTQGHYKRLLELLDGEGGTHSVNLPAMLRASRLRETLTIVPVRPATVCGPQELAFPHPLRWPGITQIGSITVRISLLDSEQGQAALQRAAQDRCVEVLNGDVLALPLSLRRRRSGDRFRPLGRNSPARLGKFLAKQKRGLRSHQDILVICDATSIVWVWPVRLSHHVRITKTTRQLARIEIQSTDANA